MADGIRPTAMALLALALLMAGCSDPARDAGPADSLVATATTGVLRGVVVDQAIRPIAGATVTLTGADEQRSTITDANGTFGFAGLAPGTWVVEASKLAHTAMQQSVEVVAGVDDPPLARLQLTFVPGELPFYTAVKVEAFIQCIVPGANLCAIVNFYPCLVGVCDPTLDDTSFVILHDEVVGLQRVPDWLQTEILWQSTQAVTPGLGILYTDYDAEAPGRGGKQASVEGRSPLLYTMGPEALAEWDIGVTRGIGHEIFGHMDETAAIGSAGFVLSQRVDFYFHAFYGYAPPDGWRFSVDDSVPPPPQ